ncbi:cleavage/packaging protein [Porcine lymphotropic herpesvirus 3]|uniref:Cleavage/packaging protein n=1 Tax=Suid gammaherpesvirus 5 TaxID=1960251 RepID=Q8B3Z3_9GAMA|nr:cleavage/packaging protein [Porcine lymphotropic herpesvirus 3]AAO12336.1 cleavage/packaging protein [Porcine lymphotropic herpesvirus 3]
MLYAKILPKLQKAYKDLKKRDSEKISTWENNPLVFSSCKKAERWPHPFLGVLSGINQYSANLECYCRNFNPYIPTDFTSDVGTPRYMTTQRQMLIDGLAHSIKSFFREDVPVEHDAKVEFQSALTTYQCSLKCPKFEELRNFIINLSSFLNGAYVSKTSSIEPFQKQLILHTFYFLISIKAPASCVQLFNIFKHYFDMSDMITDTMEIFKQKASVFLIPRRHGKTWIVVAITSILLTSIEDLHIGYVAHQKHVSNAVFTEIMNTMYRFFPSKDIEVKRENGTILFKREGKKPSTLMCATCFNKNSIRGQTFNLLYIDEANFIKKDALPTILGFMLQKDAKLIFISSSNSSDQSTSFLYKLKSADERLLNIVSYVCNEHKEDFNLQDKIISCPCYRLHIPSYITIDTTIKNTTNLFMDGVFSSELMGDNDNQHLAAFQVVSDIAISQFEMVRIDTLSDAVGKMLNPIVHMYIDPAFTNNTGASGTGISIIACLHNQTKVLLGCEHYFLSELTGSATVDIARCALSLIKSVALLHPVVKEIHISVEGNTSQDATVAIANIIDECSCIPAKFYHHADKTNGVMWPMYILGAEKSQAFESFICALNSGTLKASQSIISNTIKLSYDPVCYLIEQIRSIKCIPLKDGGHTYHAKAKNMSDDLLVAVVMAMHLSNSNSLPFKALHNKRFF